MAIVAEQLGRVFFSLVSLGVSLSYMAITLVISYVTFFSIGLEPITDVYYGDLPIEHRVIIDVHMDVQSDHPW